MASHFSESIFRGYVNDLTCPEDKCSSLASPGLVIYSVTFAFFKLYVKKRIFFLQVKQMVNSEEYEKYDLLLLESSIAAMPNLVRCPRFKCIVTYGLSNTI